MQPCFARFAVTLIVYGCQLFGAKEPPGFGFIEDLGSDHTEFRNIIVRAEDLGAHTSLPISATKRSLTLSRCTLNAESMSIEGNGY